MIDQISNYETKKTLFLNQLALTPHKRISLKKKTASNLFRYIHTNTIPKDTVALQNFDKIISIDVVNQILNVEGLAPYEKIIHATLQYGLLPTVAPELKHITLGGAIVGIGIESTGFKYGFVHDGLLEAEVLLPNGNVVLCTPDNEHADLFYALPNSYGTLGYILRAKVKLYPASPKVHLHVTQFNNMNTYLDAMQLATAKSDVNFIEGLVFAKDELFLMETRFTNEQISTEDIYRKNIFYKMILKKSDIYLTTEDYIFRYDPDWFWNIPENWKYNLFRRLAPKTWRNSGFYKKYIDRKKKLLNFLKFNPWITKQEETLIQDWEVNWTKGMELLDYALTHINLMGKPWVVVPIKPLNSATIYPVQPNQLYFNLGCYCSSKRVHTQPDLYHNTRLMDDYCFKLGGLKMLYSSTLLSREKFSAIYNGEQYLALKKKYDPENLAGYLYDKVARSSV